MKYRVEIDYQKGPSFSVTVNASTEFTAKALAISDAKAFGFSEAIKKITVKAMK